VAQALAQGLDEALAKRVGEAIANRLGQLPRLPAAAAPIAPVHRRLETRGVCKLLADGLTDALAHRVHDALADRVREPVYVHRAVAHLLPLHLSLHFTFHFSQPLPWSCAVHRVRKRAACEQDAYRERAADRVAKARETGASSERRRRVRSPRARRCHAT